MNYAAYSDESGTGERFTCIATLSLLRDKLSGVNSELAELLSESDVTEFKWQKLKDAKYRHCAIKLLDLAWRLLSSADARVDVVVWDNHDARHAVQGRDDAGNFGRMFFHLHSNALRRRPRLSRWHLFPDERVEIDWDTVRACLDAVGQRRDYVKYPLLGDFLADPHYEISEFRQVQSHKEPCCQIADLFAGLAVFSRSHYSLYEQWVSRLAPGLGLWDEPAIDLSNREKNRFRVLEYFNHGCKSRRLGVSLKTFRGLHTPKPSNPINFWLYEPQHEQDRAPTRRSQAFDAPGEHTTVAARRSPAVGED